MAAIEIGTSQKAVKEVAAQILAILEADCDEATKRSALKVLGRCINTSVEGTQISNCSFIVEPDDAR